MEFPGGPLVDRGDDLHASDLRDVDSVASTRISKTLSPCCADFRYISFDETARVEEVDGHLAAVLQDGFGDRLATHHDRRAVLIRSEIGDGLFDLFQEAHLE
jgi:hypothetical protein